ncbi:MAG TPA: prolyl oligopeptidase family serine peptidase [Blastocatellia bacterium]|nr:prolyl oligopeptidase family serine peptidase [Blastocatellia bacterium]
MKRTLILALACLVFVADVRTAQVQQAPSFIDELLSRYEEFHRLYNQKRRLGADVAAVDPLRQQSETAFKAGNVPLLFETVSKGIALLEGKAWDEKQRFISSLVLDIDRQVIEPNNDLRTTLVRAFPTNAEQSFAASPTVTFEVRLDQSTAAAPTETPVAYRAPSIVIGERIRVSQETTIATRRLRLADGVYWAIARVEVEGQVVAEVDRPVFAISNFTERVARLASLVSVIRNSTDPKVKAVANQVATPQLQLARLAGLNKTSGDYRGNVIADLDRVEFLLAALAKGTNPLAQERGEIERAYAAPDGRPSPYRLYIPLSYNGSTALPLIVLLHGAFGDERSYFSGLYDPVVIKGEAERRGIILAAVNGGGRVSSYSGPAEEDVFQVVAAVMRDYKIDPARIFLTGHSNGAMGTWSVAAAKPDLFAAIAPVSGGKLPQKDAARTMLAKLKGVPALVIHGTKDSISPVANSREFAAAAQKAGVKTEFVELEEADHIGAVAASFPAVMQFFTRNGKAPAR